MSLDQETIINQLKLIASLQEGQTLSTSSETTVTHNAWLTTLWRTYYSEDRKKSMQYINNAFLNAITLYQSGVDIKNEITKALQGLEKLKLTYKDDHDLRGLVVKIIDDTNVEIEKIKPLGGNDKNFNFFNNLKNKNYNGIEDYLFENNDPNILNEENQNALHITSQQEFYNKEIMGLLLQFRVDTYFKDKHNNTPLYYAIITECTDAILCLEDYNKKLKKKQDIPN